MAQRPASITRIMRNALSLMGGIILEISFILWLVLVIMGVSAAVLFFWEMVG